MKSLYNQPAIDFESLYAEAVEWGKQLQPYICDTNTYIQQAVKSNKRVLFEGAQGALLDNDFGTYPFVTSSNTTSVAAGTGSGVPSKYIRSVFGVVKAYTTRVGSGPFPTEAEEKVAQELQTKGGEFGSTTGRPRRCGWLDLVQLKYAIDLNGVDKIILTKLDVLSGTNPIKLCTAYKIDGKTVTTPPACLETFESIEPIYEELPGFELNSNNPKNLPDAAKRYIEHIERVLDCPICIASLGPERQSYVPLEKNFSAFA